MESTFPSIYSTRLNARSFSDLYISPWMFTRVALQKSQISRLPNNGTLSKNLLAISNCLLYDARLLLSLRDGIASRIRKLLWRYLPKLIPSHRQGVARNSPRHFRCTLTCGRVIRSAVASRIRPPVMPLTLIFSRSSESPLLLFFFGLMYNYFLD